MTPDQIFGCVAIAAMMVLVVSRMSHDPTPAKLKWRMALIWAAIIVVIIVITILAQRRLA